MCRIFYEPVDIDIVYDILERCCIKTDKHYTFNQLAYKQMVFLQLLDGFLQQITPFYRENKREYVTREMNFVNFLTILKQICNSNGVPFSSRTQKSDASVITHYYIKYSLAPKCLCRKGFKLVKCRRCRSEDLGISQRELPIIVDWGTLVGMEIQKK